MTTSANSTRQQFLAATMFCWADNYDGSEDSGCDFDARLLAARLAAILDPAFVGPCSSWLASSHLDPRSVPGERIDDVREAMELWREIPEDEADLHPLTEEAVRLVIAMKGLCCLGYDCEAEGNDPETMCEAHANEYWEAAMQSAEHLSFWGDR